MRKKNKSGLFIFIITLLLILCTGAAIFIMKSFAKTPSGPSAFADTENGTNAETGTQNDSGLSIPDTTVPQDTGTVPEETDTAMMPEVSQQAKDILTGMSVEEKVGQLFIARYPAEMAAQLASEYQPGGYILFGQDFAEKTKDDITFAVQSCQVATKLPLFIGVDEEGGTVNRVSTNPNLRAEPFKSPQTLFAEGGLDLIRSDALEKSDLLHSLGINLNFAPVCDISQNPEDFMYARSFGKDAAQTSDYVTTVVNAMNEKKMGSVLKHFPGYGNNADTHTGTAVDERPFDTFTTSDFLPFKAGIDANASMVLVSHNIVNSMDADAPASLSEEVHRILRQDLGFDGVIITDDLAMEGVRSFADDSEVAIRAVQAGNDMLCCTDFEVQIPAVLEAVKSGEITEERIDASVLRILQLKIDLGII